jgi:hypothetical protein
MNKPRITRRALPVVVGIVLLVLAGLAAYTQLTALTYGGLKDLLRAQGATIQDEGISQPLPDRFLTGTGHRLRINGMDLGAFEYQTTLAATYDASRISADGTTLRPSFLPNGGPAASIDFIAPPHWFHKGHVIVLYVGRQGDLVALLRQALGPQFAGG